MDSNFWYRGLARTKPTRAAARSARRHYQPRGLWCFPTPNHTGGLMPLPGAQTGSGLRPVSAAAGSVVGSAIELFPYPDQSITVAQNRGALMFSAT